MIMIPTMIEADSALNVPSEGTTSVNSGRTGTPAGTIVVREGKIGVACNASVTYTSATYP